MKVAPAKHHSKVILLKVSVLAEKSVSTLALQIPAVCIGKGASTTKTYALTAMEKAQWDSATGNKCQHSFTG
jgi:hypothetical protein